MDSADAIFQPVFSTATYPTLEEAIPGLAFIRFEGGKYQQATRIDAKGFAGEGPILFRGENFDFADLDSDGGRVDFWIKFNTDPNAIYENTWVARSNYPNRDINFEFASSNSTVPTKLMIDVYGDTENNWRTNYLNFRVTPRGWDKYENIQEGEWHLFTVTWRRNGGPHKAELHIYLDGTQEGCYACNDYNGNLPAADSVTDFFISPRLYGNTFPFSIDEVYSFHRWNVSDTTGTFADLQIPEGVTLTFPQDSRGAYQGVGARPVPESNITFEFFAINAQRNQFDCDLYVDTAYVATVTTTSQAHTEVPNSLVFADGIHHYQVKCDNDRLVSPVTEFTVTLP
jgi:hypothetical protein